MIRSAEKVSGLELDWYLIDFAQTTNTIDYGVRFVSGNEDQSLVSLSRVGLMPMPTEVTVTFVDGTKQLYYIPLRMMRGEKPVSDKTIVLEDWAWTHPSYSFTIDRPVSEIKTVVIDKDNK